MLANSIEGNDLLNFSPQVQRAHAIEKWIVDRLAKMLRVAHGDIDVEEPFANYGLGSYQGVELAGHLADWLGQEVPETLVWDYPTIKEAAQFLSRGT